MFKKKEEIITHALQFVLGGGGYAIW